MHFFSSKRNRGGYWLAVALIAVLMLMPSCSNDAGFVPIISPNRLTQAEAEELARDNVGATPFGTIVEKALNETDPEGIELVSKEYIEDGAASLTSNAGIDSRQTPTAEGMLRLLIKLTDYLLPNGNRANGSFGLDLSGSLESEKFTVSNYTITSAAISYSTNKGAVSAKMSSVSGTMGGSEMTISGTGASVSVSQASVSINVMKATGTISITANGQSVSVEIEHADSNAAGSSLFSGGYGTEASPYLISNADDLEELRTYVSDGKTTTDSHFHLTNDIALTGDWTPIGKVNRDESLETGAFKGIFDGGNHTVSGLSVDIAGENDVAYAFISGIYGEETVVRNLAVTGSVKLTNPEANGSLVVGFVGGGASVENCTSGSDEADDASAVVSATAGGVVSRMFGHGEVIGCVNYADVTGNFTSGDKVGGVISTSYTPDGKGLIIMDCVNYGNVSGDRYTGGVVGFTVGNTISGCDNYGVVKGALNIGGVVGQLGDQSSLTESDNHGDVFAVKGADGTGISGIGGVVGYALGDDVSISMCENHAAIAVESSGDHVPEASARISSIGGILGKSEATSAAVSDCTNFSEGSITIPDNNNPGTNTSSGTIGGIVGSMTSGRIERSYNHADLSGAAYVAGIIGSGSEVDIIGCENYGDVQFVRSYNGGITAHIANGTISDCLNTGSVIVTDSASAAQGVAGGIMGSYDGTRKVEIIRCVNGSEDDDTAGEIKASFHAGGIVGGSVHSGSTIVDSTNYGKVTGNHFTGGIAGEIGYDSTLTNVKNHGEIIASDLGQNFNSIGGIVGRIYMSNDYPEAASISGAVNTGDVTVDSSADNDMSVGGIIGSAYNHATISKAESSGTISDSSYQNNKIGGIVGSVGFDDFTSKSIAFTDCTFSGTIPEGAKTIIGSIGSAHQEYTAFTNCNSSTDGETGL